MTAYYLKYRPQSLDELVGQEAVKKILLGAFKENRISHAYLLVGPRGTGKTSTARILAKMVNCESLEFRVKSQGGSDSRLSTLATSDYPCNKCSTCMSITDGSNLDLIEIDAASNRGIEDIRVLREKIKLSPTSSKKKVYIIDEVHMLTTEAFNALLKTLEEPPSHALFILATTDVQKLPQTILSRVQRLDFKLASPSELFASLQKIVTAEKIDIDEEALKVLVSRADGSFRDGIKILDQISSLGEKITTALLEESLRSTNFEQVLELIKSISRKDTTSSLSLVVKQIENGTEPKGLILSLMDYLRSLVFIKNGLGDNLVKPNMIDDKYQALVKISESFSNEDLVKSLEILQKALEKLKFTSIPSLPLELAVVEICGSETSVGQSISISDNRKVQIKSDTVNKLQSDTPILSYIPPSDSVDTPISSDVSEKPIASSDDILKLKEKWTLVLETIRPYNFSLEALLRSVNITECTSNSVIMEVPYSFHQRILEAPKNRDLLEGVLSDILGRSIHVSTILGNRTPRKEDIANIEVAADDEIIRVAAEIFNSDSIN